MPVQTKIPIECVGQTEFHAMNEKVMGLAFRVHSELGRFCHEKIYQNALHQACLSNGFSTSKAEAEIQVLHKSYSKSYFVDLFVANGIAYETKTVECFNECHRRQLLNYLMLLGLFHGTLLNFRTQSLQHEFVSTRLTLKKRRRLSVFDSEWDEVDSRSKMLKRTMLDLLDDWGAFLDCTLYTEAVTFFLGGPENVLTPVDIIHEGTVLGAQKIHLLTPGMAFKITAATKNINYYRKDLLRFLSHTNLKSVQWINLNHHNIEFRTLKNDPK